jgi:PAS domain S-box-containing protein
MAPSTKSGIDQAPAAGENSTQITPAEKRLREAYDIINKSPAVAFVWLNAPGWPVEFVSENVEKLFGYTAAEFMERKVDYSRTVHPEDLARVAKEVETYSGEANRQTFTHAPYRIITSSGEIKWISDKTHIRRNPNGNITHYQGIVEDITALKKSEEERERLIKELKQALAQVKKLSGLVPICAFCKKIRDDKGFWQEVEEYIRTHSEADFSHGICPECKKRLYPELCHQGQDRHF